MATFIGELRRRQVVKVAGVYMIVSWLCVQVASVLTASLNLPPWTDTLVTVLLALGFPIACVIAWAFELSPDGLQRTRPAARVDPGPLRGGGILDYVVAAGVIAILVFSVGRQALDYFAADSPLASSPDGPKSIAVLPFKNLSADGDDSFSDGLTIEILSTLAQTGQFRVPGRSSSFRYKDQPDDLRAIGRALGVEYLIEGSVRRSGDDLRIEAQLVQADDGFLVWSDVFVDEMKEIFVLQEKIANAIGAALKTPLGIEATTLQTERTNNPEAYDFFLKALGLIEARGPGLEQAVELLEKSVEIEPDFAAGWGALSLAYGVLPIYVQELDGRPVTPARYYRKALASALQAAKLDTGLPIVQHATGNVHRRNRLWISAEDNYRRALAQEPNDHAVMKDYSSMLAILGHHEQAVAMAEQMRALDPLNPHYEYLQALYLWQAEHDEESIERLVEYFEKYRIFDEIISGTLIGYMVATDQIDRLKRLLGDCPACDQPWRGRALAMIDAVGTQSPGSIFDTYKDEMFVRYHFWDAVGGPDLVLEAFEYNGLKTDSRLQLFAVPWSLIGVVGDTDEFKQVADDMGLVAYWRNRGWPDRCKPLEGDDFECR